MNILYLTSQYPNKYKFATPVCHYFAKDWVALGHNVKVIHNYAIFPIFFYWAAKFFKKRISKLIGNDNIDIRKLDQDCFFIVDRVNIYFRPIFKFIPHGKFPKKSINRQFSKIIDICNKDGFVPDTIIGHFHNPQIELIAKLKRYFPMANSCVVLHESPSHILKTYGLDFKEKYSKNIDVWGFRFKSLEKEFKSIFGTNYNTFICYSGLPEKFIDQSNANYKTQIRNFVFVGSLIKLKRVSDILYALEKVYPTKDFSFDIVGNGMEEKELKKITKKLNIEHEVNFLGKLPRLQVQQVLRKSDCFIMVSKSEAFGLVYLEAMGKGCITIGTKGQGIDGVIKHGVNGFLVEASNIDELVNLIEYIKQMPAKELTRISENAVNTTKNMTDSNVAKRYLKKVLEA